MASLIIYLKLVSAALYLNPAPFSTVEALPTGLNIALITVVLAGISSALGQSVVLFINRVKPVRAAFSLILSSLFYVLGYLTWTASIWLIARLLFKTQDSFEQVLATVGLGYAPQLFAFFAFIPFFGMGLSVMLGIWSFLAVLLGVEAALELSFWQAFLASLLGYALLQGLERTIGYPVAAFADWLRARAAGVSEIRTFLAPQDLIQEVGKTALISVLREAKS